MGQKGGVLRFIKMATQRASIKKKNSPPTRPNKFVEIKKRTLSPPTRDLRVLMKKVLKERFPKGGKEGAYHFGLTVNLAEVSPPAHLQSMKIYMPYGKYISRICFAALFPLWSQIQ